MNLKVIEGSFENIEIIQLSMTFRPLNVAIILGT
jgi:hypothetical protein